MTFPFRLAISKIIKNVDKKNERKTLSLIPQREPVDVQKVW